jgi:hypothetical protein
MDAQQEPGIATRPDDSPMTPTPISPPDSMSPSPVRPGDFARILVAGSGTPPRARARDRQADLAGEALRRQVLNRLIVLDPEPEDLEETLMAIVADLGEPTGPTRGICTALRQEWEMAAISPEYWSFLVGQALSNEKHRRPARDDVADEARSPL